MKKILFPFLALLLTAQLSFAKPDPTIIISNGQVKINNTIFNRPWGVNTFASALGTVERVDPEFSSIYTYDSKGIILYVNSYESTVSDFNVYFNADPNENFAYVPKAFFKGSVKIENFVLKGNSSLKKLKAALPTYNFVPSSIGTYRGEYNHLYIHVQFDPKEKKVLWISVGKIDE